MHHLRHDNPVTAPYLTVTMPPGAVDGYVATAAQVFADDYRYDPSGSTLTFHKRGNVDAFVGMLRDAMEPDFAEEAEKPAIRHAIQLVIQELARQMVATHGREKAEAKAMSLALSQRTASALEIVAAIRAMEPEPTGRLTTKQIRDQQLQEHYLDTNRRMTGKRSTIEEETEAQRKEREARRARHENPSRRRASAGGRPAGVGVWRADEDYERDSLDRERPPCGACGRYTGSEAWRGDTARDDLEPGRSEYLCDRCAASMGRRGNPIPEVGSTVRFDPQFMSSPMYEGEEHHQDMILRARRGNAGREEVLLEWPDGHTSWTRAAIVAAPGSWKRGRRGNPIGGGETCGCEHSSPATRKGNPSSPAHHITESRSLDVANTILEQLGGARRLSAMIGAKNFMGEGARPGLHEGDLQFQFSAKAKNRANAVRVELKGDDTYTVTFYRTATPLQTFDGIYADGLTRLFELQTGLALRL